MFIKSHDKIKIWYSYRNKSSTKPTLIFIHGWAADWTSWKKEIDFFNRLNFPTLTLDLRGHGKSDKPNEEEKYSLYAFAKDIEYIRKKEQINKFILIGHSMGGMISLNYYKSFKSNKLKSLILCSTTYRNILEHNRIKALSPLISNLSEFIIKNKKIKKKYFSHIKDSDLTKIKLKKFKNLSDYAIFLVGLQQTSLKSVFSCLEVMMNFNFKDILKKINIPTLILDGDKDPLLSTKDSKEMYKEIKNSEIDFIKNGKHYVNLESPKLINNYILKFLEKNTLN